MASRRLTLYGLKNCDSTRKARRWLQERSIEHGFVDVREDGVAATELRKWVRECGWETLLNRRSTTWKSLGEAERAGVDEAHALALLERHPTLMKRPVLVGPAGIIVGFDAPRYARELA